MPKIKIPSKTPRLDMTPMVDLAFLLVTFFMLTTKFRPDEPVVVDTPFSTSELILPEKVMLITVDSIGRVFFNLEGQETRKALLDRLGSKYNIQFSEEEKHRFSILSTVGIPMKNLKEYLDVDENGRKEMNRKSPGIPVDSLNNELVNWIIEGRYASLGEAQKKNKKDDLRFAIRGDAGAPYTNIKKVIDIFQERNINTFSLTTSLEEKPKVVLYGE